MLCKKMEIAIPSEAGMDFDFNSARSSPHPSAPSSPKRFGNYYYTSAPSSPSRISDFYQEFDNLYSLKMNDSNHDDDDDDGFAFNFNTELEQSSQMTAEELFDGGKIRPFKPLPKSPGKNIIRNVFSPRNKKKVDLFSENSEKKTEPERGRQRRKDLSSGSRRAARSLSPYRTSEYSWHEEEEEEKQQQPVKQTSSNSKPPPHPAPSSSTKSSSSRKWRFTDFLLFRSASEGRAADKDPLRKYSGRRKGQVSAHELHYTKNKAASQDLKKKTFLPYKSGILGFRI